MLGPSSPRDAAGFGVDIALDPFTWVGQGAAVTALNWTRFAVSAMDQRERVLDAVDNIKKTALDPYATFRSLYRQHRESQIEETRNDNRATIPVWFPQPAAPAASPRADWSETAHADTPHSPDLDRRRGRWPCSAQACGALRGRSPQASAFVKDTGEQLVGVVNGPGSRRRSGARLQQVIDSAVDVDGHRPVLPRPLLAQRHPGAAEAIRGPVPRRAAEQHQRQAGRVSGRAVHRGPRPEPRETPKSSTPSSSGRTTRRPRWTGSSASASGSPKIVDVVAEGTSLRLTQRSDYASYLARNNNSVSR